MGPGDSRPGHAFAVAGRLLIAPDRRQRTRSRHSALRREGFRRLVTDVGLGRAGIVMGLEVSRLARNNAVDEHHFASKSEQPARGEAVCGLFLGQLTRQVVGSGSVGSFRRERRSLA